MIEGNCVLGNYKKNINKCSPDLKEVKRSTEKSF